MRRWTKAIAWGGILLGCAAVGAFIASRSNPFPPGVPDPGAVPSETPAPGPPAAEVTRWTLLMKSRSTHTYRVGGSCTSDWRMEGGRIRVSGSGRVRGRGVARVSPGASCDFPSAQVQARGLEIEILGRRDGGRLLLRFRIEDVLPPGSQDLGALAGTLERLRVSIREGAGARERERTRLELPDGDVLASLSRFRLAR